MPVTIKTTALCAHTVPPEFAGKADDYVTEIMDRMLPALARDGLVDAVDGFCDSIGFTHAQTARVFDAARALGLPVKLHADQVSAFGGAEIAARYGALSAEHLEYASETGKAADLVVWPTVNPGELSYWVGAMSPKHVVQDGKERAPD